MPSHYPTPRRALELLAQCRQEGCSETLLLAHGFTIEQLVELGRAGLVTATADRVVTGAHQFDVATLRITDARRKALANNRRAEPAAAEPYCPPCPLHALSRVPPPYIAERSLCSTTRAWRASASIC
jgi:hypothetical protein